MATVGFLREGLTSMRYSFSIGVLRTKYRPMNRATTGQSNGRHEPGGSSPILAGRATPIRGSQEIMAIQAVRTRMALECRLWIGVLGFRTIPAADWD